MRNPDIWKNHAENDERKKKREFSTFLADSREKRLSTNQTKAKCKQTFWNMAADNVKAAFHLPSGVNEDFIRNLIWQHHQQQQHQKKFNQQQQQNINQFKSEGVSKHTQEKACAEVSF